MIKGYMGACTDVWIRVPREDGTKILAAVGGWVGREMEYYDMDGDGASGKEVEVTLSWRVKSWGNWLAGVVGGDGMDLFK